MDIEEIKGTKVLKVRNKEDLEALEEAGELIRRGELVAFPTETVYGLGGNALDPEAAGKIYAAKGRPSDNPLIVHVAHPAEIEPLVRAVPEVAERLMARFWPGPLTLIFPARPEVPRRTTGGLDTVAIRLPSHPVALAFLAAARRPVAGPSANLSGRPSPTTAGHVITDLAGRVAMIIDGGHTGVGVESTVLDVTVDPPQILRPGGVTLEELREVVPDVTVDPTTVEDTPPAIGRVRAPGMKYKHYAPEADVIVFEGPPERIEERIRALYDEYAAQGRKVAIMATAETAGAYGERRTAVVGARSDLGSIANNLFDFLRRFDAAGVEVVLAEGVEMVGLGLAVMNRLRKAAGYHIVKV
ncbi:MAG TPA: threonylcarbamoyl-AMP synthase [Firmicutes bacterium]|uniref:L-threonylcarbamoyladenylate synthase n=1 Tax=Gelria sp. Kuro-4 TaxID=2796927 RepID=UPI0019CED8A4|nr:L-threonylcarbamoyladenylate synthase [Gelria sp. Kuro-4]MDK2926860.1 L-threonylcarbamoyladenylate synthase [Bacillota bacterium]BCV24101.1 threonylcarbamoyl-AMP synthase [Gelria sp. Kuro-4]HHV57650.1 threonylcarbamoyl-AMP synthase [Bacillota bacterium]